MSKSHSPATLEAPWRATLVQSICNSPIRPATAVTLIKSGHTIIFAGMAACVLNTFYSGVTGRSNRLTKLSITAVLSESLIYWGNKFRCPLADIAEDLGAESGTVGDIFLPGWFARRIPLVSSTLFLIGLGGLALHHLSGQNADVGAQHAAPCWLQHQSSPA